MEELRYSQMRVSCSTYLQVMVYYLGVSGPAHRRHSVLLLDKVWLSDVTSCEVSNAVH